MATGSVKKRKDSRVFDVTMATRGIWLVKVPNYMSEVWKKAEPHSELGKMRIISNSK